MKTFQVLALGKIIELGLHFLFNQADSRILKCGKNKVGIYWSGTLLNSIVFCINKWEAKQKENIK